VWRRRTSRGCCAADVEGVFDATGGIDRGHEEQPTVCKKDLHSLQLFRNLPDSSRGRRSKPDLQDLLFRRRKRGKKGRAVRRLQGKRQRLPKASVVQNLQPPPIGCGLQSWKKKGDGKKLPGREAQGGRGGKVRGVERGEPEASMYGEIEISEEKVVSRRAVLTTEKWIKKRKKEGREKRGGGRSLSLAVFVGESIQEENGCTH